MGWEWGYFFHGSTGPWQANVHDRVDPIEAKSIDLNQFGFRWSEGLVGVLRLDMLHHVRPTRKSVVEVIEVKHIRTHCFVFFAFAQFGDSSTSTIRVALIISCRIQRIIDVFV